VEAELGELPCGVSGHTERPAQLTDPALAERFVEETGVDLLAVSVGNVHIQMTGQQDLDLERLAAIRDRVSVPLVLHGGTGISAGSLAEAVRLGVAKVNYGTYLKQRYLAAVRLALANEEANPHALLGLGGPSDVIVAGRLAVRDAVLERIESLGCCERAW
jgi:fructose/tagatose bisphosphate aldolase